MDDDKCSEWNECEPYKEPGNNFAVCKMRVACHHTTRAIIKKRKTPQQRMS
jgi:hypothetical protein